MFTGIIEEIGNIKNIETSQVGKRLTICASKVLQDTKIGDSICVNGVCQTVIELSENFFKTDLSFETLNVSNFSDIKIGYNVNLERALTLSTRLGGHLVSGHVDCVGEIIKKEPLTIAFPEIYRKYITKKGSISINGISLTVKDVNDKNFSIAIIPHTLDNTALKNSFIGEKVNLEVDILAKYVENFLSMNDNRNNITEDFLIKNGF